jgi:hypothetical protein
MRSAFLVTSLFLLLPVACSSDKKSTTTDTPEGGAGNKGTGGGENGKPVMLLADGGCPDPMKAPVYDGVSKCLTKEAAIVQCESNSKDQSPEGTKVDDLNCGAGCTCTHCAAEMFQCNTDPDCVKILLCAQQHNCVSTACYAPDKCMDVIDQSGGGTGIGSNAVALVQLVNACATKTVLAPYDYTNREGPVCMAGCQ